MIKKCYAIFVFCCILLGCTARSTDTLTQISTIDALLAGVYDGEMSCRQLLHYGDLGIGTFNGLDGEMIVLDGKIFQIKADGKVYLPALDTRTPFASVVFFEPEQSLTIHKPLNSVTTINFLDSVLVDLNGFYAIRLTGDFSYVKTRSVPAQTKPYPTLAQVSENQPEFTISETSGTIVGFRCPPYVKGLNVPGYHWHYLNSTQTQGGHALDFEMQSVTVEYERLFQYSLILLKDNRDFENLDLNQDRSQELEKAER